MPKIIYVTGGIRSGKTGYAQSLAESYAKVACIDAFIPQEEAYAGRSPKVHNRPQHWDSFIYRADIDKIILQGAYDVYLLDNMDAIVSDWVYGNSVHKGDPPLKARIEVEEYVIQAVQKLMLSSIIVRKDLIIVSCEAGLGLSMYYPSTMFLIELCGKVNQMIASEADEVYFMVSGIPQKIK